MWPRCWILLLLGASGTLCAGVEGIVLTSAGTPIEHARVEIAGDSQSTFTDQQGWFRFREAEPPIELQISHPRFELKRLSVPSPSTGSLRITLAPKQQIYEEIAVSANRGEENFSPVSVAASVIDPSEATAPPSTLAEMVSALPAVSENGQGGIFQTYSIRGIARQRVLTLVSGMRIVGERRAGVSASFLEPRLLGSVDVLRGPSSTYYGSGALGGVVHLFPRRFESLSVETGYASQGDESYQLVGWGNEAWSVGVARRDADDAEAPDGVRLFSGFSQTSMILEHNWSSGQRRFQLQVLGSRGEDIHKASTDFPERATVYPEEEHLLMRFSVRSQGRWMLEAWAHPNTLRTRVEEGESLSELDNQALDFGFNWQRQLRLKGTVSTRFGIDYFGRRNVDAVETVTDLMTGESSRESTLRDAEEDEAGAYGALEWNWGRAVILAGGRFAWQRQQNDGRDSGDDSTVTGFAGLVLPLGAGFELAANLGSGLRFPSLSERFFSGVTGRGQVGGNIDLDAERSLSVDTGLRWYGEKLFVSGYVFRNRIDDYVERIEIAPDQLSFVNLTSGTIEGMELDGLYQFDDHWSLGFGGHLLEGRDDDQQPLADIPADRFFFSASWRRGRWASNARWEKRFDKNDPGSGEKPIPSADLLAARLDYGFDNGVTLSLSARNLLDEEYLSSADRKVPLSAGRSIGVAVSWHRQ